MTHHQVIIVGGGTAGISVAARLCNFDFDVAVIEPSTKHYYQPLWTLVGGGVFEREITEREEADVIPTNATWIHDAAASFDPDNSSVTTVSGDTYTYDVLVVAPGIQLNWGDIKGLEGNVGKNGICSNYAWETVESTWENVRTMKSGNAVFTFPATPIKCAGAPQKIMWLAEHYFEKQGVREDIQVHYGSATASIFGIEKYKNALNVLAEKRNIVPHYAHNLIEVRAEEKIAVFEVLGTEETFELDYEMLHVVPPQSAPDFVSQSPLANAEGWVDVDKFTTQHNKYSNVFSLGDASSLPCSKTGAAIRKQAPVTAANIQSLINQHPLKERYDGYASCPLVTGYGRLILAEFGYDGTIMETFPFDQAKERYSMWAMKVYGLPDMYWHGMLQGRV